MHDSISVLILPFIEVPLDLTGVEGLQTVGLNLESLVYIGDVLNVVVDCLGSLLLNCYQASRWIKS